MGKRRTDRSDSSESSDSGVATLSPSATELISSPYSPCCDLSSDSSSTCSSPAQPHPPSPPVKAKSTSILGHPIMTAVSAVLLASSDNKRNSSTSSVTTSTTSTSTNYKGSGKPFFSNCDATINPRSKPTSKSCIENNNSSTTVLSSSATNTKSSQSSATKSSTATGKHILAAALNYHQQQERQNQQSSAKSPSSITNSFNNNNNSSYVNKNQSSDLIKVSSPSKRPRLERSSCGDRDCVPSATHKVKSGGIGIGIVTKKLNGVVMPGLKKVKKKFAEESVNGSNGNVSKTWSRVEARVVQGGRVCSVGESLKVSTSLTPGADSTKSDVVVQRLRCCMWKGCQAEPGPNLLEHIQTVHVTGQTKADGYVCLWEGCKVYNRKSSSLSWLERHVLSHSGNKPFKCIFPGCGQSFGVQGALERHVNSHMTMNGGTISSFPNRKMESSPFKGPRRKKQRCRKQRLNIGQHVDYFDKRVMEVIKHKLAASVNYFTVSAHNCTFRGQVVAKRVVQDQEPQVLVQWYPLSILPDEWVAIKSFQPEKSVPLTQIPKHKLALIFPSLFPCPQYRSNCKGKRKWSLNGDSCSTTSSSRSEFEDHNHLRVNEEDEEDEDDEDDWTVQLLEDHSSMSCSK